MTDSYREQFNAGFSAEKYRDFLRQVGKGYPPTDIRFSETPVFIPADLKDQLVAAGEAIIGFIRQPDFKSLTDRSIPAAWNIPGENGHPHFMVFDFAVCNDKDGRLVPQLIEMQGFPSLFGLQPHLAKTYIQAYGLDNVAAFTPFFNGMDEQEYYELLKKVILGPYQPEEVALVDFDAPGQKTALDFYITQQHLGFQILSVTDIYKEGNRLYYQKGTEKICLKRIFNRMIFDELQHSSALEPLHFDPREALDIEWITHPNWFYRISKFTMPFLKFPFVPETHFLNTVTTIPADLENYVLKPLFSFAGQGVIVDLSAADISSITDPENWILQRKVDYAPAVASPEGPVKVEIRLMYLWPDGEEPRLCINLVRMSRGKMIGVAYNHDYNWVGGTVGLMEA